jgi:hypothetical protein
MDNLSQASGNSEPNTGALDIQGAADIFANMIDPEKEEGEAPEEVPEIEADAPIEAEPITVEIDGKEVVLTKEQIAEAYKNGLRQSDYTKKTMEIADQRKEADAVKEKATQERNAYAEKLSNYAVQLQGSLQEQSQINMAELLESDPVEYLKQTHLLQQRQATLQQAQMELQKIGELNQQEQQEARSNYLQAQNQALLDKLPAWKDEAKATADKTAIKNFLKSEGYSDAEISQVADHRHILILKDALAFRQLLSESPAATKRVQAVPVKAERTGAHSEAEPNDARKQAMKRLGKSGSLDDAASYFSTLL